MRFTIWVFLESVGYIIFFCFYFFWIRIFLNFGPLLNSRVFLGSSVFCFFFWFLNKTKTQEFCCVLSLNCLNKVYNTFTELKRAFDCAKRD
uniref:Uncharacterized protein n=1 Tax=Salix viminalis TaxID=40686 RepID=A0A6N2N1J8_SALVM